LLSGWVWRRNHSDAAAAGRGRRKESVVRGPGGLEVGLKRGRKTVERRNLTNPKTGLEVGAESEIDTGTETENTHLPRELHIPPTVDVCIYVFSSNILILWLVFMRMTLITYVQNTKKYLMVSDLGF